MRQPNLREVSAANEPFGRSSRSGRAVRYPPPLGRAEQRSSVRMKALALFERSEFASAPNAASSARDRVSGTDVARLFFGYFFLATQKKVTRPPGRDPACHRSKVTAAQQTPSLLPQGNHKGCPYALNPQSPILTRARHAVPLRPHPSPLTPHPYDLTPHPSLLRPHSYDLTPHSSPLTPPTSPLRNALFSWHHQSPFNPPFNPPLTPLSTLFQPLF